MPNTHSFTAPSATRRRCARNRTRPTQVTSSHKRHGLSRTKHHISRRRLRHAVAPGPDERSTDHGEREHDLEADIKIGRRCGPTGSCVGYFATLSDAQAVNPYSVFDSEAQSPSHFDGIFALRPQFTVRHNNPCSQLPPSSKALSTTRSRRQGDPLLRVHSRSKGAGTRHAQDELIRVPTQCLESEQSPSSALALCLATASYSTTSTNAFSVRLPDLPATGKLSCVVDRELHEITCSASPLDTVKIPSPLLFNHRSSDALSGSDHGDLDHAWNFDEFGSEVISTNLADNNETVSPLANAGEKSTFGLQASPGSKSTWIAAALPKMGEDLYEVYRLDSPEDMNFYTDTRPYLQAKMRNHYQRDNSLCRTGTIRHEASAPSTVDAVLKHLSSPEAVNLSAYESRFDRLLSPVARSKRDAIHITSWSDRKPIPSPTGHHTNTEDTLIFHGLRHAEPHKNQATDEFLERLAARRISRNKMQRGTRTTTPFSRQIAKVAEAFPTQSLTGETRQDVRRRQEKSERLWDEFEKAACGPESQIEPSLSSPSTWKTGFEAQSWEFVDAMESLAPSPLSNASTDCAVQNVVVPNFLQTGTCCVSKCTTLDSAGLCRYQFSPRSSKASPEVDDLLHVPHDRNGLESTDPTIHENPNDLTVQFKRNQTHPSTPNRLPIPQSHDLIQPRCDSNLFQHKQYGRNSLLMPILGPAGECLGYEPTNPSLNPHSRRTSDAASDETVLVSPTDGPDGLGYLGVTDPTLPCDGDEDGWSDWDSNQEGEGDEWAEEDDFLTMDGEVDGGHRSVIRSGAIG